MEDYDDDDDERRSTVESELLTKFYKEHHILVSMAAGRIASRRRLCADAATKEHPSVLFFGVGLQHFYFSARNEKVDVSKSPLSVSSFSLLFSPKIRGIEEDGEEEEEEEEAEKEEVMVAVVVVVMVVAVEKEGEEEKEGFKIEGRCVGRHERPLNLPRSI
ncbi:hypothetical protein V1477_010027 [Vespula maculifrons]|uniref:Uncharacterized protein n=1 Tax=Vespula maculifrons TaxID=7453 RepID=A0ABD2CDN7_VESMC